MRYQASIYRWIGPHNRLVQMLGHYRKSFIIYRDIKPRDLLSGTTFNLHVIVNFSSYSLDSSKPASGEGTCSFLPRHWRDQLILHTDIFATTPMKSFQVMRLDVFLPRKVPNISSTLIWKLWLFSGCANLQGWNLGTARAIIFSHSQR
ncbi:hypothetical protein N7471_003022 [Penicillium samsonianum]|uniref:uncharacterized protein n=1 Tax=Penicillium samsonianum TaxID=1882272 RepID=UPI002549044D|nr:uncharacterized protein N7471_003022 [Penicillium samsonianum]KAJ6143569.1 hypothetical protein N7471_003022 [Penicillium samsonianum]